MGNKAKQENVPLGNIASDVSYLLGYLVNTKDGVSEQDAQGINALLDKSNRGELTDDEKKNLIGYRVKLSSGLDGITPETLKATRGLGSLYYWYLIMLWVLASIMVGLAAYYYMLETQIRGFEILPGIPFTPEQKKSMDRLDILNFFVPYVYGALGACIYLMRVTGEKFKERKFDPNRLPEHFNRFVLGGLSGGMIILFISGDKLAGVKGIELSTASLGFIAGYSIDFLFKVIDRMIEAILPKVGLDSIKKDSNIQSVQRLIKRYKKKLLETTDAKEQDRLKKVIEDMEESLV